MSEDHDQDTVPAVPPKRPTSSCIRCARRKVKCDKEQPCRNCTKHNAVCAYNPPPSPGSANKRKRGGDQVLVERIEHYERILKQRNIEVTAERPAGPQTRDASQSSPSVSAKAPSRIPDEVRRLPDRENRQQAARAQVVYDNGRSQLVDNSLWTRVVHELPDPNDVLKDSSNDEEPSSGVSDDDLSFVFGEVTSSRRKRLGHPSAARIHKLWQIFVENVDPVTKVIHVPTVRPAIDRAADDPSSAPRGFQALMFAIYSAAIMTLDDETCATYFSEPRKVLLSQYTRATKTALARARFMSTSSLVVLQALVVHLLSVRDVYEPRAVWTLTGVAVRIAQGMGLERDGASMGLPPFETEIRRRVWWLLKTHDFRTTELCGLPKFREFRFEEDSTKWPTNVNDDELYPGMSSPPKESAALTDMVFVAMRDEISQFTAGRIDVFRRQGKKNPSDWNLRNSSTDAPDGTEDANSKVDAATKQLEEIFETKYFRYCDPSQPLHLMSMLLGRYVLTIIRFLTHHPRRWPSIQSTPPTERALVWSTCIKLLEQQIMMQSNPSVRQFSWQSAYFQQWHALIHVLDTLRVFPLDSEAGRAWEVVGKMYDDDEMGMGMIDMRKPILVAVGGLCLKAWRDREVALGGGGDDGVALEPPGFIVRLRKCREEAKARKEAAREGKRKTRLLPVRKTGYQTDDAPQQEETTSSLPTPSLSTITTAISAPNSNPSVDPDTETGATQGGDAFWSNLGLDDGSLGFLDMMDLDVDFGHGIGASNNHHEGNGTSDGGQGPGMSVSWEQWDAWVTDSSKAFG